MNTSAPSGIQQYNLQESAAERNARHIAMLQRMADIGMDLAGRAAEDALRYPPTQASGRKGRSDNDPHVAFARLSRCVQETLALKARIARAGGQPTQACADTRHATILAWLHSEIAARHQNPQDGGTGDAAAPSASRH